VDCFSHSCRVHTAVSQEVSKSVGGPHGHHGQLSRALWMGTAHHSFCPMASSHCVVVSTCNNKNREEILSLPTKSTCFGRDSPSRASILPDRWWSLSYCHNGNNAATKHLHQGLNPKYTHMVLSDHPDFHKICMLS
jgi:hypothetical protein